MQIMNPIYPPIASSLGGAYDEESLKGASVALVDNTKPRADDLLTEAFAQLSEAIEFGDSSEYVKRSSNHSLTESNYEEISSGFGAALVALGD